MPTRKFAIVSQAEMSLARVETLISGYRAWMCAILGLFLAHPQPVIAPFSSCRLQHQEATIFAERAGWAAASSSILRRNILLHRKAIIGGRSWSSGFRNGISPGGYGSNVIGHLRYRSELLGKFGIGFISWQSVS